MAPPWGLGAGSGLPENESFGDAFPNLRSGLPTHPGLPEAGSDSDGQVDPGGFREAMEVLEGLRIIWNQLELSFEIRILQLICFTLEKCKRAERGRSFLKGHGECFFEKVQGWQD